MHTHVIKAEDIINRGGATLVVELFGSDNTGGFDGNRRADYHWGNPDKCE